MTRCERGFSLLELMVVIVIIAMLFTFTTLRIRSDDPIDQIKNESLRFNQLVDLLLDEAILRGEDFGIEFEPRQYQFVRYNDGKWLPITDDKVLRLREMPGDVEIDLSVEQTDIVLQTSDDDKDAPAPQVFVLSSGEITPEFSVAFFVPTITTRYVVTGRFDGKHSADIDE